MAAEVVPADVVVSSSPDSVVVVESGGRVVVVPPDSVVVAAEVVPADVVVSSSPDSVVVVESGGRVVVGGSVASVVVVVGGSDVGGGGVTVTGVHVQTRSPAPPLPPFLPPIALLLHFITSPELHFGTHSQNVFPPFPPFPLFPPFPPFPGIGEPPSLEQTSFSVASHSSLSPPFLICCDKLKNRKRPDAILRGLNLKSS